MKAEIKLREKERKRSGLIRPEEEPRIVSKGKNKTGGVKARAGEKLGEKIEREKEGVAIGSDN